MNSDSKHNSDKQTGPATDLDERLLALRQDILEETAVESETETPRFGRELPSQIRPPRWLLYALAVLVGVLLVAVILRPVSTTPTAVVPTVDISVLREEGAPVPPIMMGPQELPGAPPPAVPPVDLYSPYPDG